MPRKGIKRAACVAGVVMLGLGTTSASAAITDNMYPTSNANWNCWDGTRDDGLFCQTDNATLTYYIQGSVSATGKDRIKSRLTNQYAPTDLTVKYDSSPSYSGPAETDIIYQRNSGLPSTTRGRAWCNDAVTNRKCDQHYVAFKSDTPPSSTACHETGHAVGLTHGQNASPKLANNDSRLYCMVTPSESTALGSHNKSMINSTY